MKNLRNLFSGMLAVLAVLLLTGCGEKDNPVRTSLDVDTSTLTLSVGESAVRMAFSKAEDAAITYTSSKPAVATVDQFGKVTAMSEGSATITIEMAETKKSWYAAKTITYEVVVKNVAATGHATGHALSASAVGEIVGSDGRAYAVADKNYMPSGVTAVAMVAYKSGSNGLAIQLNSSPSKMSWSEANAYTGYPTISGNVGTWRLPSHEDWIKMFTGCAIDGDGLQEQSNPYSNPLYYISGFMEKIAATGTTWVQGHWSSTTTGTGSDTKYGYVDTNFSDSPTNHYYAYICKMLKSNADNQSVQFYVLGCLAF